jgi:hypothetical protein
MWPSVMALPFVCCLREGLSWFLVCTFQSVFPFRPSFSFWWRRGSAWQLDTLQDALRTFKYR